MDEYVISPCKRGALSLVIYWWVLLCVIVSPVVGSFVPVEAKLFLCFPTAQPVQSQVHRFQFFGENLVVNYTLSCCIVCLDRGGWLRPSYFYQGLSHGDHFLSLGDGRDRSIPPWDWVVFREKNMGPRSTASLGFIVKSSIGVCG